MSADKYTPQYCFNKPFEVRIPERLDWGNNSTMLKSEDVVVYTDGSKMYLGSRADVYSLNPPPPVNNLCTK